VTADDLLYERMVATLLACWAEIAAGTEGASVERVPGAAVALFPAGPERLFYNNAVFARGLDGQRAGEAVQAALRMYEHAEVERFAIWVHESEEASIAELARRGLRVDTATRAMAISLDQIALPRPEVELASPDWAEYLRIIEAPEDLLAGVDASRFTVLVARLDGEDAAAGMAYDHDGDCGIFNLGTVPGARRRGLGSALTALHVHLARDRGCVTASLQSTEVAESVYARLGFRSLGRFIEYSR
jgi:ribosomal protein S18 acetylase RimI-like enzyme